MNSFFSILSPEETETVQTDVMQDTQKTPAQQQATNTGRVMTLSTYMFGKYDMLRLEVALLGILVFLNLLQLLRK